MLALRDHAHAKAPYVLAGGGKDMEGKEKAAEEMLKGVPQRRARRGRPALGRHRPRRTRSSTRTSLWSCTTCGACVEQCPVDIEHVDHIIDMRRYQVMIESAFPSEAGTMLKNIENKGNPWGMPAEEAARLGRRGRLRGARCSARTSRTWTRSSTCTGSAARVRSEDRAKKTTKAFAELLHIAGVKFAILGGEESCTGDPARRLGNEFLFQMQAMQNVEMLNEVFGDKPTKKIVATCPHCFNSLANEYPQLGGHFDVIHHTQLLDTLVNEGRLTPVTPIDQNITYHDPCYLGRHNKVYTPAARDHRQGAGPAQHRDAPLQGEGLLLRRGRRADVDGGADRQAHQHRAGRRGAVHEPDVISTACPYCLVMLGDSITARKQAGEVPESMEVVDVSQLLLRSVK